MSADMHIHVLTDDFTKEHYIAFQSNCFGGKYFNPGYDKIFEERHGCDLYDLCAETPDIWVGEVSWLKAAILDSPAEFIPDPVGKIAEIIGDEFPIIDDDLINRITEAMDIDNKTSYSVANPEHVVEFLERHRGKAVFTISW